MKQNVFTGANVYFFEQLKESIKNATQIDINVSFIMESGVKLLIDELKHADNAGVKIRILTTNYLNITQPQALYLLKRELKNVDICFYNNHNTSFHPKAYIFHCKDDCEIYIGSSNISKGALTNSIEWNHHFTKSDNEEDFNLFYKNFEELFNNHSTEVNDDVLKEYANSWIKPKIDFKDDENDIIQPRDIQIEALYELDKTRRYGYDKALVVAATGTGKTYLAAFDSIKYGKILFVAHRIEIIKQAKKVFKKIQTDKSRGFFYNNIKETDNDITFALVQTLGKDKYLNEKYFKRDAFDYIIIDEFHHAVANNYRNILNYFQSEFLLGLTATPERLDNKDVFALCDYNNVYEIRLKEAINRGFLTPFKYYGIMDDTIDYSQVQITNGKYDEKDLEKKLMIHKRANLIMNHYQKYNSKQAIGFCSTRVHAEYMAKYFNEHGIESAAVYSGKQGKYTEDRTKSIEKLKQGIIKIIFTVDMFNEGLDVPSIDMVLFLRPTESPTIFLQQLGRGLRKYTDKKYLTVLDFIGNYKKANTIPFLLSGNTFDTKVLLDKSPLEFEYPVDCHIDFDFELINLFKYQSQREIKIEDKILLEYENIKNELGFRPSRVDLLLRMDENIIESMRKKSKTNIFNDYLKFLKDNDELTKEEEKLLDNKAHKFINTLETTKMTKSYKLPILLAFYNKGNVKMKITSDDVYMNMKEFYDYKSNEVDMLKDKTSSNYKSWGKKEFLSLARRNPIKYLNKSHGEFFIKRNDCELSLNDELTEYVELDSFKQHFKDILEYKRLNYYKNRYEKGR